MSRDSAEHYAEIDSGGHGLALRGNAFVHPDSDETNVVGISNNRDRAAVIEGDVELSRQPIHIARVQNVGIQRLGQWSYIEQFLSIDAGDGRSRNVADVIDR